MILLVAAILIAAPASPKPTPRETCREESVRTSAPAKFSARRLGEMPNGKQIKALRNLVDGCPEPIVVRQSVGSVQPQR